MGRTTLHRYDSNLRPVADIDSLGNWSQSGYDQNGNDASSTDGLGFITLYVANARGLVTRTTDPNGDVVQDQFYATGALQTEINARGFSSTTTIDARGLGVSRSDNLGFTWTFSFDPAANETSSTDPDNNPNTQQFDADNRLTISSWANKHRPSMMPPRTSRSPSTPTATPPTLCQSAQPGNLDSGFDLHRLQPSGRA
jgi:YD repeat-containing protein